MQVKCETVLIHAKAADIVLVPGHSEGGVPVSMCSSMTEAVHVLIEG